MDIGLLVLRVAVGLLLFGHGAQKVFGWFGGHGLAGTGAFFDAVGFRPGRAMALLAGLSESGGGLLLGFGLLAPLAGAVIIGTMLTAASTHFDHGLWATGGGYELPLLYAVSGATVALAGPGAVSLDNAVGLGVHRSTGLGLVAVGVGILTAATVVVRARWGLRHAEERRVLQVESR